MRAIDTHYNGYKFRSRLEARWAVFFDSLGIKYEYETEGFDLDDAGWYLPDFWLLHPVPSLADDGWGTWAEIKPRQISKTEFAKVEVLARGSGHNALIFQGRPWPGDYSITRVGATHHDPPVIHKNLTFIYRQHVLGVRVRQLSRSGWEETAWKEMRDAKDVICLGRSLPPLPRGVTISGLPEFGPTFFGQDLSAAFDKARDARFEHRDRC